MLTIIFGAGASYDSAPINSSKDVLRNEWRPPLTKDLFLPEKVWFRENQPPDQLIPIIERIRRDTTQNTLENALEKLKEEIAINPIRWEQILAIQEWLQQVLSNCSHQWSHALGRVTTYVDLLSRLYHWQIQSNEPISLITFNYDTLIERAASLSFRQNIEADNFNGYISNQLQIFKPHGSVNWWWDIPRDPGRKALADRPLSGNERKNAKLHMGKMRTGTLSDNTDVYYPMPAIAIPVIRKSNNDFVFPPGHYEKMIAALDSTEAILVIGWAGAEEHFMAELSKRVNNKVPVLVVCGSGGSQTVEKLHDLANLKEVVDTATGFSGFLNNTGLENWLNDLGKD